MKKLNKEKKSCKDVFNSFMLSKATYVGYLEFPVVDGIKEIPQDLICFSKIQTLDDYSKWIHPYEHDYVIERIWKYPQKYLPIIKKYAGIISPDFSLYRDMPLIMQIYNIFRSRTIARWLQDNGVKVIINVRFGDKRTYRIACMGIPKHCTIAIGTHGTMKDREDRKILEDGVAFVLKELEPSALLIYGTVSKTIIDLCKKSNVQLIVFQSDFGKSHLKDKEVR